MNEWYYWTCNQHAHFIRFRRADEAVAKGIVRILPEGGFQWTATWPCWMLCEETGWTASLDEAKQAVNQRVDAIIQQEYKAEYVPPLG